MSNLPCMNPNCKSHGKPHPNCKCHGGYAKGGRVKLFCSTKKEHLPDCEYFAGGGEVTPKWEELSTTPPETATEEAPPDWDSLSKEPPKNSAPEWDDLKPKEEHYNSPMQQGLTAVEGAARGVLGPIATMVETGLRSNAQLMGIDPNIFPTKEDIAARIETNPNISKAGEIAGSIGSLASGVGIPGMAAKATAGMGSVFLKNALPAMAMAASDEVTKSLLGQGDPNDSWVPALTNVVSSGLFGGALGKGLDLAAKGASSIGKKIFADASEDVALGSHLQQWLEGAGYAQAMKNGIPILPPNTDKAFRAGLDFGSKLLNPDPLTLKNVMKEATKYGFIGLQTGGLEGALLGAKVGATKEVSQKAFSHAGKFAFPTILKVLSNSEGDFIPRIAKVLNYAKNLDEGTQVISKAVNGVFQPTAVQYAPEGIEKLKNIIKNYIDKDALDQEIQEEQNMEAIPEEQPSQITKFAHGGEVKAQESTLIQQGKARPLLDDHDPMARYFPDQNMGMQSAKMRVYNYLKGMKPNPVQMQLPFDRKPNLKGQEKKYDKALDIAAAPLSVFNKIQSGRLTSEDVGHLGAMYPELYDHLKKKVTDRLIQSQLKNEKPNGKVRRALSIFMGVPMSTTMTQPMLAAAQATFANKGQPPQQGGGKPSKGSPSKLDKISDQYRTDTDTATIREQRVK